VVFDIVAPPSPLLGDFWMDLNDIGPPGGGFLPLGGGTMSGAIDMDSNAITNIATLSGGAVSNFRLTPGPNLNLELRDASLVSRIIVAGSGDLRFFDTGGVMRLRWNDGAARWDMTAPLWMDDNDITLAGGNINMGDGNISNLFQITGRSDADLQIQPGATRQLKINDDSFTQRIKISANSVGDIVLYDAAGVAEVFKWREANNRMELSKNMLMASDVPLVNPSTRNITVQTTPPNSPRIGDVWMDNS
jgi:hypothetical protein